MKRRHLLLTGASAAALAACSDRPEPSATASGTATRVQWRMATSWPPDSPGLSASAARLAARIGAASGGRIQIDVSDANEVVPPFGVLDAVAEGTVQMGHSAAYYWQSRLPAAPFFCTIPFGMRADEISAWFQTGNGLAFWEELYAPLGVLPIPCGNTGVQTAAWSNREIASLEDLQGLKIRIPGLGAAVLSKLGAQPLAVPGTQLLQALRGGQIDAAEWLAPMNDLAFGLHRVARYCYYPGWQEPGAVLECLLHKPSFDALSADLQTIIRACCAEEYERCRVEFQRGNVEALKTLSDTFKTEFRRLPDSVSEALRRASTRVLDELAARDAFAARVLADYRAFQQALGPWRSMSETAYEQIR
ncbi:TRAP transporter substrate-binding protein [Ahniella affigens]|nr:TRAP transporter substrate-binding protein [Ahniella affigens]